MMTTTTPEVDASPKSVASRFANYGWATIAIGAIAMAATYPDRTHGLGMVTEPLLNDLGLADPDGRVFDSTLNLWGTLLGALFCLPVGWLFDRFDRRWILAANLVLLGFAVGWMSTVETWQQLFLGLILTRGLVPELEINAPSISLVFTGIPANSVADHLRVSALGQSAMSVVSITLVAKSFRTGQLGYAMAWYAILSAPFHLILIKGVGWALKDGGPGLLQRLISCKRATTKPV